MTNKFIIVDIKKDKILKSCNSFNELNYLLKNKKYKGCCIFEIKEIKRKMIKILK